VLFHQNCTLLHKKRKATHKSKKDVCFFSLLLKGEQRRGWGEACSVEGFERLRKFGKDRNERGKLHKKRNKRGEKKKERDNVIINALRSISIPKERMGDIDTGRTAC